MSEEDGTNNRNLELFLQRIQSPFNKQITTEQQNRLLESLHKHDEYTAGTHSLHVAYLTLGIFNHLDNKGDLEDQNEAVFLAGLFHDVGKLAISRDLINKQSGLTHQEKVEFQQHVVPSNIQNQMIGPIANDGALYHHSFYGEDGYNEGYPASTSGNKPPLIAQIVAVADVWSALTSTRTYTNPSDRIVALEIICSESGTKLNPEILKAFIKYLSTPQAGSELHIFQSGSAHDQESIVKNTNEWMEIVDIFTSYNESCSGSHPSLPSVSLESDVGTLIIRNKKEIAEFILNQAGIAKFKLASITKNEKSTELVIDAVIRETTRKIVRNLDNNLFEAQSQNTVRDAINETVQQSKKRNDWRSNLFQLLKRILRVG